MRLLAVERLQGVQLKMARAREHLEVVEQALTEFRQSNRISVVTDVDLESNERLWRVESEPPTPPLSLYPLVGDAIYNFRSALDHLAWEMVLEAGGRPSRDTSFPLFNSDTLYERFAPAKVKGMSPEMLEEVRSCQPCYGVNPYRNRTLWALESLCNIDKHRHFNISYAATLGGFWLPGLPVREERWFIHAGPIEKGTILARLAGEYVDVDFAPALDISFGEGLAEGHEASVQATLIGFRELLTTIIQGFINRSFK